MKNCRWMLGACLMILPSAGFPRGADGPTLVHKITRQLPRGTHRPEILVTDKGEIVLVVVQPEGRPGAVGQIKHQAYRYTADWAPIGKPFVVTQSTTDFGEPADHRAALVNGELVVVYQSLRWKDDKPLMVKGPSELFARDQSLLLSRFTLDGKETLRKPIVAHVTDFAEDNFPDHCLLWRGDRLLVSTGSMGGGVKIREVSLEARVLATHTLAVSEQSIPGNIGNSLRIDGDHLFVFSASDPRTALLSCTELDKEFRPVQRTLFDDPSREENFPTSNLTSHGLTFVGYISRDRGGVIDLFQNPYHPYLKVLDKDRRVVADVRLGTGGFAHVHPTLAQLGDRLFVAWSKSVDGMPQVQVEDFELSFK